MSLINLLDKTCDIYYADDFTSATATAYLKTVKKYSAIKCRLVQKSKKEDITNGKENLFQSFYRLYIADTSLNIKETDFIIIENKVYDVLYVNRLYKVSQHLQIDLKIYENQEIDEETYFINEKQWKLQDIYQQTENDIFYIIE